MWAQRGTARRAGQPDVRYSRLQHLGTFWGRFVLAWQSQPVLLQLPPSQIDQCSAVTASLWFVVGRTIFSTSSQPSLYQSRGGSAKMRSLGHHTTQSPGLGEICRTSVKAPVTFHRYALAAQFSSLCVPPGSAVVSLQVPCLQRALCGCPIACPMQVPSAPQLLKVEAAWCSSDGSCSRSRRGSANSRSSRASACH